MPSYPHLSLDRDALETNIRTMAAWCEARGVGLAPHVKTTMSPEIVRLQAAAGAVALTVATVDQAAVVAGWGYRDVLVANEVVDEAGLRKLYGLLAADPGRVIRVLVDSVEGVDAASRVFDGSGPRLSVLLDVGADGGRTGVRSGAAAGEVAAAAVAAPGLSLVGVCGYEGVAPNRRDAETLAAVDAHCRRVRDVFLLLAGRFETAEPVFTMGGSAFPDRVVDHLPTGVPGTRVWLRSGCYVTHDHGTYAGVSPVDGLVPALAVAAVVLSTPEPGVAVLGAGKRDLAYDAGLPVLLGATGRVRTLFDHHAVVDGATVDGAAVAVGDVLRFGISHPCSAFDRWPVYVASRDGGDPQLWTTDFSRATTA
jgi:D-serine deaminase-like pyridoxal phosphate-dependent protein